MPTISPRPSRRALVALALAAMSLAAGCAALVPQDLQVPKVYIKDYAPRIRAEQVSGEPDQAGLDKGLTALKKSKTPGMLFTPKFIYTVDPVFLLQVTEPREVPPGDMVSEPYFDENGLQKTRQVMRKPMFMLDRVTISYQIPGYEVAPVTLEQNLPIKSNDLLLEPLSVAQVQPLVEAFGRSDRPSGPVTGTFTATLDMRDLDPLASQRSFQVTRSFPLRYTYQVLAGEAAPEPVAATPTPAPSPSPAPTASPAPTPTPVPLQSPTL